MNSSKIITIICWSISALVLAGLACWFLFGSFFGIGSGFIGFGIGGLRWENLTGPYEPVGTYNVGTTGIDSLYIDWAAGEITVNPYNGSDIKITEFAQRQLKDDEKLSVNTSGGTVTITYREGNRLGNMPSKKLEVLVPRELSENLSKFTADSTSGRIYVSDLTADKFTADTVSGGVELFGITARTLTADSTSGKIFITDTSAEAIDINSVSGSIEVEETQAFLLTTESTSGNHTLSGDFDSVNLNSVSGDLLLENGTAGSSLKTDTTSGTQNLSGDFDTAGLSSVSGGIKLISYSGLTSLDVETTSGTVTVTIPNDGEISVSHSSTSGKLSSDVPIVMRNSGAQFRFSTTSGDVKILVLN